MIKASITTENKQNKRVLIFSGGNLGPWALSEIRQGDILIGADRGSSFLIQHGYAPDLALGDFDSVTPEELEHIRQSSKQFQSCDPVMKDETDTEMALDRALELHPSHIEIFGALGTRFDHSLANVHLLAKALQHNVSCKITDERNQITLINRFTEICQTRFTHVSLLPLTPEVTGVTLEGFLYPLNDATLTIGHSLGISNVLAAETGRITVQTGQLLVMQSRD